MFELQQELRTECLGHDRRSVHCNAQDLQIILS